MVTYIDNHKEKHGVESICNVLPIAPSTYYDWKVKQRQPEKRSIRAQRDDVLKVEIQRIWEENFRVYGVRKVWHQLKREDMMVARCTVERLMKKQGLRGVVRGRRIKTTLPDNLAARPLDRVNRDFVAFSCKRRGFCPSCGARRMVDSAAHLVDEVLPKRPIRQWVLSVPYPLRYLFATNPKVMSQVLTIVHRVISRFLIKRARMMVKSGAQSGAVTLIQRFGSALNLNPHFHMLYLNGVYDRNAAQPKVTSGPSNHRLVKIWILLPIPLPSASRGFWKKQATWSAMQSPSTSI